MASNVVPKPEIMALLSAASLADIGASSGTDVALRRVAGQSLLGGQIQALRQAGITNFLIEVDNVPAELLNLADDVRQQSARVEFVRSVKDLRKFLGSGANLVVQAEDHYFTATAVDGLMQKSTPFVATVDGRDENAAFERIDLNTRWAGFAILDAATALSMVELPQGWSITSSLLRHAVQNKVRFQQVEQATLQRGEVMRVTSQADADKIVLQMLADGLQRLTGFVERHIFGNIARKLAPAIWSADNGVPLIGVSAMIFAGGSIGFAILACNALAAFVALIAIFLNCIYAVVQRFNERSDQTGWLKRLFWVALIVSLFSAAWTDTGYGSDTLAFTAIVIGLAALTQKMKLPRWAAGIVNSPALLAIAVLIAATVSALSIAAKIVALTQLSILIAAKYLPDPTDKNRNQA